MLDSGVGGLTVLKSALAQLPAENYVYVGDTAHMPYGEKSPEAVVDYTLGIGHYLLDQHQIKALVVACNTASACALPALRAELGIPVIGVIDAGVRAALSSSQNQQIGLIATAGTVQSKQYQDKLAAEQAAVLAQAEPDFVQLVEHNQYQDAEQQSKIRADLAPFVGSGIDTLILGCTHFPLLAPLIQAAVGNQVRLVDPGAATVAELDQTLSVAGLHTQAQKTGFRRLYTTGPVAPFTTIAKQWLGQQAVDRIDHLDLTEAAGE